MAAWKISERDGKCRMVEPDDAAALHSGDTSPSC